MIKTEKYQNFTILTFENGLRVLIYPQDHVHSVTIHAMVRGGHLGEEIPENGVAHLVEHMLFDGTAKFPTYQKLSDYFDKIAGAFGGTTSWEKISIGGNFVDEELESALIILNQLLFEPLLTSEFMKKEKTIIYDELKTYEDSNEYIHFLQSARARFNQNTILSYPLGGYSETVKHLTLRQVRTYYEKYFRPDNTVIVIAGNCRVEETQKLIKGTFTHKKPANNLEHSHFSTNLFSKQTTDLFDQKSQKAYIRITFPSYSWKDPIVDRVALSYLSSLLANRKDSVLFSKLREENGWIYDINAGYWVERDLGVFAISTSCSPDKTLFVIETILKSLKEVKYKKFSQIKFERVKDIDRKRMKMAFDTTEEIVDYFSEEMFYRYPIIKLPKYFLSVYNKVTTERLRQVAQETFSFDKINVCVLQKFGTKKFAQYDKQIAKYIKTYC